MGNNTNVENEYGADQIQILEGLEAVRKRPGMYIGTTSTRGLHHLVYEIVDNAVDEALAGYCSEIDVQINKDNSITVKDNGRGIPVGINEKTGLPAVQVVFTVLHAGGKFGGGGYKVSGGLHGVGASVVNALSQWLEVKVCREGKIHYQKYEYGHVVSELKVIGECDSDFTGTEVTFLPDNTIFEDTVYQFKVLEERLRETAFLTKNLKIILRDVREEEPKEEEKPEKETDAPKDMKHQQSETFRCIRMIYETLLDNEVNERYVNQILDDVEKNLRGSASMDIILSNVYQKMVLKFGQPQKIELVPGQPKIVFFIGPTGVGKTTTIAKVASRFKVDYGKKVAFLTADTYRIAAAEQLRTYANILDTPLTVIYSSEEMNAAIERVKDYDLVLVDTAGFSYKNEDQRKDMRNLIESLDDKYEKDVYLVLSATTKYRDLMEIVDKYHEISDYKIIFTKLDETSSYGSLLNIRMYSGADVSYVTTGQNVPDDIEIFQSQKIVKQLLGGR